MDRRRFLQASAAASFSTALPAASLARSENTLRAKIGRMLLLGFIGDNSATEGADQISDHLEAGRIGGVLFLRHNVRSREGVEGLTARFRDMAPNAWMAVDQEGGAVQRLSTDLGYSAIPRAHVLASENTVDQAREIYSAAAEEFHSSGFNMNLAPVADFQDEENGVIGRWGRGYGADGLTVAAYAAAFVQAFEAHGSVCAIKHFPGHGRSSGDSHHGFVDISESWSYDELDPFRRLIEADVAHLIMGGHLTHSGLDPAGDPVTFSRPILQDLLRSSLFYRGALITDDLDMGAIRENYDQRTAVIRSIQAGNDLIMMSNSAAPDPQLPQRFADWVEAAIEAGDITEAQIDQSVARLDVLVSHTA